MDEYIIDLRESPQNANKAWLKEFAKTVTDVCNCKLLDISSAATLASYLVKGKEVDIRKLVQLKEVEFIERNMYVVMYSQGNKEELMVHAYGENVPWGLQRITQRGRVQSRNFRRNIQSGTGMEFYIHFFLSFFLLSGPFMMDQVAVWNHYLNVICWILGILI